MRILSGLRRLAFWSLDLLKGSPVKKAYHDVKRFDQMSSESQALKEHQAAAWERLKEKACTTTRFYRPYRDCGFQEFPIITKNDIRANQEAFLSSDYEKETLVPMATSGSTGTPFICYQNPAKKNAVRAEVIYYSEKVGYQVGNNLSYIRSIVKQNKKSPLAQFMQNQTLIDCRSLDDDGVEALLADIRKQSRKGSVTLLAYSSTYTAIKNYVQKKGLSAFSGCRVTGMISGSEMLYDETRAAVRQAFGGAPMVSRYSNEENGILGQDAALSNVFVINEAHYHIEIVDDDGNRLPDGTPGRIVVTDLYNYGMPMIRYDTGDMGAIEMRTIDGKLKRCISQFSGRKVDTITDTAGKNLSPHVITNQMWEFPEVKQFQLVQTSEKGYLLRLNVPGLFSREQEMRAALHAILGADAKIAVEHVDEIPVMASGKRRYIVNAWKNPAANEDTKL